MKRLIYISLLSAASLVLAGCAHSFVELDREQLQRQPISIIELEVAENKVFVQDSTVLTGIVLMPFVENEVNRARERALNPIRSAMQNYDLQIKFANRLRELTGEPPFSAQMEVSPPLLESTALSVAKMKVRVTLSMDYTLLEVSAWLNYHQNPLAKKRYHKTYISMQELKQYGVRGKKAQISKSLEDNPQPLIDSVEKGMQEVVDLFSRDLRTDTSLHDTTGETVWVRMLHSNYGSDMQIVAEHDGRSLLVGGRVAAQIIAQVPSAWAKSAQDRPQKSSRFWK